jgi:hypothetical protein
MSPAGQEEHARDVLARSRVQDWDSFRLTTCYAADQCQNDMCCPFRDGCASVIAALAGPDRGNDG